MRVLSIPHAYSPVRGGAERYVQGVCEQLVGHGHTVRVVVADMASPEAFYSFGVPRIDAPAAETLSGVEVRRIRYGGIRYRITGSALRLLPPRLRDAATRRWLRPHWTKFTARLRSEIARFEPDVVLTLPHLFTNVRCVLDLQADMGFPLVMVPLLHERDPYWPFDELRDALGAAGAVVAMTAHEAQRLVENYDVDPACVFTCPGGVDDDPSDSAAVADAAERGEVVLYLGRKSMSKGIDRLVAAIRVVWQTHPGAELVLAGNLEPGVDRNEFTDHLSPSERERVTQLVDVSDSARDDLLRRARCLALPSTNESFGLVVLEAWTSGTPVVVSDIPVFRETVDDGRDGILVPPADVAALATAIAGLLADPVRAATMGRRGREKAVARYTWQKTGRCVDAALHHAGKDLAAG